jgi:hypothetical protein
MDAGFGRLSQWEEVGLVAREQSAWGRMSGGLFVVGFREAEASEPAAAEGGLLLLEGIGA